MSSDEGASGGRVALITGGGTGIGRAIATRLVADGLRCAIVGRREAPLREVEQALGPEAIEVVVGDASDPTLRDGIVAACEERFGTVDVLIDDAGTNAHEPILDFTLESWRRVFATNLEASFFLAQRTLGGMRDRGWGRIVNIASIYGHLALNRRFYGDRLPGETPGDRGPVRGPAYHTSKAGPPEPDPRAGGRGGSVGGDGERRVAGDDRARGAAARRRERAGARGVDADR